jgi:hypothetical protein
MFIGYFIQIVLQHSNIFVHFVCSVTPITVGAKSITCAKSITHYDNNGHNISKFFSSFFLFPTECKKNNFNIKIGIFFLRICYDRQKNNFFLPPFFSAADFFATVQLSGLPICYWRELTHPKLPVLFLGGVVGNFFGDIFVLSVKISPRYGHPAPKV